MVPPNYVIIDAEWGVSLQYVTTVIHLKVCKVPSDHNVNQVVTYTAEQLNDPNHCQGLYTEEDQYTTGKYFQAFLGTKLLEGCRGFFDSDWRDFSRGAGRALCPLKWFCPLKMFLPPELGLNDKSS